MPPDRCPVLYSCLTRDGALAEMTFRQSLLNPIPSKPVLLHSLRISLSRVVRMTLENLRAFGVDNENYHRANYSKTQEIGDAAWFLGCDGLIIPNARWRCDNLVIFTDKILSPEAAVSLVSSEEVDWIRWATENSIHIPDPE